ncbi:MAG TPA: alpha/beta fold hydrolase [Acidimicrobiales bacterium]|nr:alpha/beta fold hydrolase [Acidimicrobiales bacterium]
MPAAVMEGAEPFSAAGSNGQGVLVCHGFTGNPQSMRPLASALAAAGYSVELPLWPGHGTTIEDMLETGWADWSGAAEIAYSELESRCDKVVVAGLSMGGTIATWLASRHPEIAGLIAINAAVEPPGEAFFDLLRQALEQGTTVMPAIGNDVADPSQKELAYEGMPVAPLLTMMEAQADLDARIGDIRCPTLIFTSRNDHVVPPSNSDHLAAHVNGPVERVFLERSFHVATIDYDRDDIASRSVEFANKVTA